MSQVPFVNSFTNILGTSTIYPAKDAKNKGTNGKLQGGTSLPDYSSMTKFNFRQFNGNF